MFTFEHIFGVSEISVMTLYTYANIKKKPFHLLRMCWKKGQLMYVSVCAQIYTPNTISLTN